MPLNNSKDTYGLVTKFFHWVTTFIILGVILVGLYMVSMPYGPEKLEMYAWHKSFGLLVLWFVGLRIIWRIFSVKPDPHPDHALWERVLARIAHFLLYIAMIGMPMSGWLMSSAGEYPVPFFGIQMPDLMGKNPDMARLMAFIHEVLAYILIGTIVLHAMGALKHHFIDDDTTLIRMLAGPMRKIGPYILILILGLFSFGVVVLFFSDGSRQDKGAEVNSYEIEDHVSSMEEAFWFIDKDKSSINFTAEVYRKKFTGEFKEFSGRIIFDPENLEQSSIDISINVQSVDSDDAERDQQILSDEWFDITKYSTARFVANNFIKVSDQNYIAAGDLTIKDNIVPIRLPFELLINETEEGGRLAMAKGQVSLDRLDFGLGEGRWESADTVGLEVLVDIELHAQANVASTAK